MIWKHAFYLTSTAVLSFWFCYFLVEGEATILKATNIPKVVLYTSSTGSGRSFSSVARNVPDLSQANFDNVAKSACILGTWIFYGSKDYANYSDGAAIYFSKTNSCFTFQNLSEKVSSLRFAGSVKDFRQDFIDLFSGIYFTKIHLRTSVSVANLTAAGLPVTNSIVVSGTSPWTLYSNENFTGRTLCVQPKDLQVPRFYKNALDIGGISPKSIRKGCTRLHVN